MSKHDREYLRFHRDRIINNRLKLVRKDKHLEAYIRGEYNRLNKRHPYDCGHTDCFCCHCHKLLEYLKPRDKKLKLSEQEVLEEIEHWKEYFDETNIEEFDSNSDYISD